MESEKCKVDVNFLTLLGNFHFLRYGMKRAIIEDKSINFAIRIVKLYDYLRENKHEYIMSKQLMRCGTSIGANVCEAIRGQSKADFGTKMNIALKEASETEYWLELLFQTDYLTETQYESIMADCKEINKILTTIVKTTFTS